MITETNTRPATGPQCDTIAKFRSRKVLDAQAQALLCEWDDGTRSFATARMILDNIMAAAFLPRTPAAAAARPALQDGKTYRAASGAVFHAYLGQSGQLLAKLWTPSGEVSDSGKALGEFVYFGHSSRLPQVTELSLTEAQEFGRATGTCSDCMRHLENDESVRRGIGPICWGNRGN